MSHILALISHKRDFFYRKNMIAQARKLRNGGFLRATWRDFRTRRERGQPTESAVT